MINRDINNLLDALKRAAKTEKGVTLINSMDQEEFISYNQLYHQAYKVYTYLKNKNIKQNSEIVFQFFNLKGLIFSFWACLMGNYIPIPIAPVNNQYTRSKLFSVWGKLDDPYLIYDKGDFLSVIGDDKYGLKDKDLFDNIASRSTDFNNIDIEADINQNIDLPAPNNDLAYIQFSSGSTGDPKGVTIKHDNVLTNIYDMVDHLGFTGDDLFLTWKPLTHDFSLVMFHLAPILLCTNQYFIPTSTYIRSPLLWFDKVNQHRATVLGTPSFGMQHLLKFMKTRASNREWDLSCVKYIILGAEQVSYNLCQEFCSNMEKYKLNQDTLLPGYGLAEATLVVTCSVPGQKMKVHNLDRKCISIGGKIKYCPDGDEDNGIQFVELGAAPQSVEIAITDDSGKKLDDLEIGHIKVRGRNVSHGYYRDEKATNGTFGSDGWLSTGDLGFISDNNLVMVGRAKEIVTVNGVNYTCSDIEQTICEYYDKDGMNKYVACNGFNNSTKREQAIIFVYYKKKLDKFGEIVRSIKNILYEKIGLTIDEVIPLEEVPKTTSGKVRRTELAGRYNSGELNSVLQEVHKMLQQENSNHNSVKGSITREKLLSYVRDVIEEILETKITDYDAAFTDFGMVSINIPQFIERIEKDMNMGLSVSAVFNYPNVNKLVDYIYDTLQKKELNETGASDKALTGGKAHKGVAAVGMSCRFPGGANDPDSFWEVLINGRSGICEIPDNRWDSEKYYDADVGAPGKMYTKLGGFLNIPVDRFDAPFFNISPKEAVALDPQQRMLLELTWEAFENAGLDIGRFFGTNTGVYVGISGEEYSMAHRNSGDTGRIDAYSLTGTTSSTCCGRISYTFGFEGPCLSVDTACSSSLTALHIACKALESGEIDTAVVAGVNIILSPLAHICFSKLQAISVDGCSKTFDASANGYGRGEGAGVIVLRRLSDALKENNNVHGVIRGTAINQDGKSNGLTAPNGLAQQKVIQKALKDSGLEAADIDYMEMHGTGTPLGDPIEVKAVMEVYGQSKSRSNPLKIGSVKSNIGHLEAAAGMASIMKVLLSFKHGVIPANLNFKTPNPYIPWDSAPVKVVDSNVSWENGDRIRRAGLNGFGFGGSNAHIILEEPPAVEKIKASDGDTGLILKLSAKTKNSLLQGVKNYMEYMKVHTEHALEDIIHTANITRADFDYRFSVIGKTREEFIDKMENFLSGENKDGTFTNMDSEEAVGTNPQIVFMFSGQGSQYVGMGKELYQRNPVFKLAFDQCNRLFRPFILKSLTELIYSEAASADEIERTLYAQPLIFSVEYSLYKLWEHFGVTPDIVLGHSIGEYAAAAAAGMMSLNDAVKLVAARGRLMDSAPGHGSMGAVFADIKTVMSLINDYKDKVSVAAYNAAQSIVISGDKSSVESILEKAEKSGTKVNRLKVSHGFHSQLMEPVLEDFRLIASEVKFEKPEIKFLSSLTGKILDENDVLDSEYWTRHIREKVDFYHSMLALKDGKELLIIEIGSDRTLVSLGGMTLNGTAAIVPSLKRKKAEWEQLTLSMAELYAMGLRVDWANFDIGGQCGWNPVQLPTYPFDRKQYWVQPVFEHEKAGGVAGGSDLHPLIGQRITTPFLEDSMVYQRIFTAETPYFMKEHIIFDTSISPAAAHISMLLSLSRQLDNSSSACVIENIEFRSPLLVENDGERTVQVYVENIHGDSTKFQIVSKDNKADNSSWTKHCLGNMRSVQAGSNSENMRISVEELKEMYPEDDTGFDFYDSLTSFGFNLGEGFRRIEKVWKKDNKGICLIRPLEGIPDLGAYILYPGVIDSIFQSAIPISELTTRMEAKNAEDTVRTMIPFSIAKLTYHYTPAQYFWCHTNVEVQKEVIIGDIYVYNENGEIVFTIEKIMARLTNRNSLLREMNSNNSHMFYHVNWVEKASGSKNPEYGDNEKYILFMDNAGVGFNLEKALSGHGIKTVVVHEGSGYAEGQDDAYKISYDSKNDFVKLIGSLANRFEAADLKFVYLADMDLKNENLEAGTLLEKQRKSCGGLLYLVQALTQSKISGNSKLWVITDGVHRVKNETSLEFSQATLWGFSETVRIEHPQIWGGIIDIDPKVLEEDKEALAREISAGKDKQLLLRTGSGRYVLRLIKHSDLAGNSKKTVSQPLAIQEEAAYLITGGTGAVGMVYAEYLVNHGARNLVLVSRRGPGESTAETLRKWMGQGVNIMLAQADICNEKEVSDLKAAIHAGMPPLKGIVHAAGTIEDKMIADQTWESFSSVLDAKLKGTVNLHSVFIDESLDFFIMLSSITSITGNVGQSNYAAANYFLNIFAQYRLMNNLPAAVVCWGPWLGSGMAAQDSGVIEYMRKQGIYGIHPDIGIKIIGTLFNENYSNVLAADVNWGMFANALGIKEIDDFLSKVLTGRESTAVNAEGSKRESSILAELKGLKKEERKALLLSHLQKQAGRIMGFQGDQLPALDISLMEQGADSLMIFSMRNEVNKLTNSQLDVSLFFNYPSLRKLSNYLVSEVLFPEELEKGQTDSVQSTDDILSEINALL